MSVIIRLQNLPWSANAADIRTYFHGLSIPEGGVHIVGGEEGDAFIAFSTDEDARQAMLRDRGKLKEVQIRLLLSSQAEMARIIEMARKQSITLHDLIQKSAVAPAHPPSMVPHPMQVAPVIHTQQLKMPPIMQQEAIIDDGRDKSIDTDDKKDRRDRRSSSRERGRSRGGERERNDRDRERDRSRGHYSGRRRRERSRSRDRYRRRSKSRERSRERTRWGSRERTVKPKNPEKNDAQQQSSVTNNGGEDGSLNWEVLPPQQQQQPMQVPQTMPGKVTLLPDPPTMPNMSMLVEPPALPPNMLAQMQAPNGKQMSPQPTPPMFMPPTPMPHPHPGMAPVDGDRRAGIPPGFPTQPMIPPNPFMAPNPMMRNDTWPMPMMDMSQMPRPDMAPFGGYPMMPMPWPNMAAPTHPQMAPQQTSEENENCIEIRSLPLNATYVDVKRLFDGLTIPSDGIKMINDDHGNRTGIAYVRFSQHNHKLSALNQNGKKVRSNMVEVLHLSESIYSKAIDNYRPEKDSVVNSVDMDIENSEQHDESKTKQRYLDPRMASRDMGRNSRTSRDIGGRDRDRDRDRDPRSDRDSRHMNSKRESPSSRKTVSQPSTCVMLHDLPPGVSKSDVFDFFSSIGLSPNFIHLVMEMGEPTGKAVCQFSTTEGAEKALSKDKATIGRYTVSVQQVPVEEVDAIRRKSNERWEGFLPLDPTEMRMGGGGGLLQYQPRMMEGGGQPMYGGGMDGNNDRSAGGGGRGGYHQGWNNNNDRYNKPPMGDRNYSMMGNEGNDSMPPFFNRGGGRGGGGRGHPGFRGRGGSTGGPPRTNSPYIDGPNVNNFGKPGCVVAMENIHYRADVDEIISFFDGFKVEREDIIRRFDDNGRPTGDARVSLKSPAEALRAVRTINFNVIRGRTVKLSIL